MRKRSVEREGNRTDFDLNREASSRHQEPWTALAVSRVLERFPNQEVYTCAAGISPSGIVHFGNFRDVMTAHMVAQALKALGQPTRLLFSWDDFDRFRKVPAGIDASFSQYIGKPLSAVPDPCHEFSSYAERYERQFETALKDLGIDIELRYQTQEYKSGRYDRLIIESLNSRGKIADILLSCMSDKSKKEKGLDEAAYREHFYPISVYSRFSGKDTTTIRDFDGRSKIRYYCHEAKAEDSVDVFHDRVVKLSWKVDWPMRWGEEKVVFEPGGKDHASPGGSYDVSSVISEAIFKRPAPVFQGYEFIGLQGGSGKMSGSKGDAVSPAVLLEIYEPELLKWLYARRDPMQPFDLAFGTEVNRQYEEFDAERRKAVSGELSEALRVSFAESRSPIWPNSGNPPISFRQAAAFGQITQWDIRKLRVLLEESGQNVDHESLADRVSRARIWVEQYNPDEAIRLVTEPSSAHIQQLTEADRRNIAELRAWLERADDLSIQALEAKVYGIPKDPALNEKENARLQRNFFKAVYGILLGKDTGPRLSTFLWAVPKENVINLLAPAVSASLEVNTESV